MNSIKNHNVYLKESDGLQPNYACSMEHVLYQAMDGHPGRDTDLILRPSESTIDFRSIYRGFRSLSSVKINVSTKILVLYDVLSFI